MGMSGRSALKLSIFLHQPPIGDRLDRNDAQVRLQRTAIVVAEDIPDIGEDALHLPQKWLAAQVQRNATAVAVEQGVAEVGLKHPDAIGDGGGRDFEFSAGPGETLVPGCGLEKAQTLKRWER